MRTRSAISVAVTRPMSGNPKPDAATPATVRYPATGPVRVVRWAEIPSKTPGAMMSSRLFNSSRSRRRAGVVVMAVLSVQCAGDRRGQQIDQVVDVVKILETDHCPRDRVGAPAVGDPV